MLKIDLEYKNPILFIRLEGMLNRRSVHKIYNYINPALSKHQIKYVIYNLRNLTNIDEYGIDAILSSKYQVKKNSGKIYLCEVSRELSLKIKRLRIKIFSDEISALKQIEVNM